MTVSLLTFELELYGTVLIFRIVYGLGSIISGLGFWFYLLLKKNSLHLIKRRIHSIGRDYDDFLESDHHPFVWISKLLNP